MVVDSAGEREVEMARSQANMLRSLDQRLDRRANWVAGVVPDAPNPAMVSILKTVARMFTTRLRESAHV